MIKDLLYLIPLLPLIGFVVNGLFWKRMPKAVSGTLASALVLGSFVLSLMGFMQLQADPNVAGVVTYFPFISVGNFNIPFAFQYDQLSATFLLIITGVGFLIHLYSIGYMQDDAGYTRYFSYLNLFVFAMLILVLGANYLMMFIGWEGVGLASYLLIGFWFKNKDFTSAGNKAFIMNRIGDLGFLIGMMLTLYYFGTLTYGELFPSIIDGGAGPGTMVYNAIAICFFIGAMGKSAQIPLYTWLPDAMAGPTPVSALIHAATMVTAGIYMIARSSALYNMAPAAQSLIAIIGAATAFVAATIALKQYDIKKVLAYSTVSQLGYMFLALGVGAYVGGVFHMMTHAFFKALLFLAAGSVIHGMSGEQDLRNMGGLGKKMRITQITFLIGCLAIAGIPGFSGFFSKDEILAAAFAKNPVFYAVGLVTAVLTAFYMFRLYFLVFTGSFRGTSKQQSHLHESPWTMSLPLVILAIFATIAGYVGLPPVITEHHWLATWLSPVVQNFGDLHLSHNTEWMLMVLSTSLIIITIIFAYFKMRKTTFTQDSGLGKVLLNKWYVDEIYETIIVRPITYLSEVLNRYIEHGTIDGSVNGVGKFVNWSSAKMRYLQSGQVGYYLFAFVLGMILLFIVGLYPFLMA